MYKSDDDDDTKDSGMFKKKNYIPFISIIF